MSLDAHEHAGGVSGSVTPDPVLAASIYCEGSLDEVFRHVVAPLSGELEQHAPGAYIWTVRYGRRGRHLKIRVHGREVDLPHVRERLSSLADDLFAKVEEPRAERLVRPEAPAIDPEDEGDDLQPDRTLLWTSYRRSHVSLGGEPFLSRDPYAALVTESLARGCELFLSTLANAPEGPVSSSTRQKILVKALLQVLPAAGYRSLKEAVGYLRYHRDWLLRFFLNEDAEEREALDRLDRQIAQMPSTVNQVGQVGLDDTPPSAHHAGSWPGTVARLARYLEEYRDDSRFRSDPFAPDSAHPAFFKVFHGTANQTGLRPMEEAFVHHLLIAALTSGTRAAGHLAGGPAA